MKSRRLPMLIAIGLGILAPFFTNMDFLNPNTNPWPEKETVRIAPEPICGNEGPEPTVAMRKVNHKTKHDGKGARHAKAKVNSEKRVESE
jgi:hypothetical protein